MTPNSADSTGAPVGPALRDAKQALRERIAAARDALPPAEHALASRTVAQRIVALPSFVAARVVLLTLPFRSEWDTRVLVRAALAAGKTVVLPRVDATTRMLALHSVTDLDADVGAGYRGIPEPRADCPVVTPDALDWLLMPGLAFDAQGGRLGYGGGFYDRLLPLVTARVPRVAGAFDLQLVPRVPAAPHDRKVDAIATPTRTILVTAR